MSSTTISPERFLQLQTRICELEEQSRDYTERLKCMLDVSATSALRMSLEKIGRTIKSRDRFIAEYTTALAQRTGSAPDNIRRLFRTRFDHYNRTIHKAFNPARPTHRLALHEALSFAEKDDALYSCLWRLSYRIDDFKEHPYVWSYATNERVPERLAIPTFPHHIRKALST